MDEVIEQQAEVIVEAPAPAEVPPAETTPPEMPAEATFENIVEPTSEISAENPEAGFFVARNQAPEPEAAPSEPAPPAHNWEEEWGELARVHPEVVGGNLPEDIFKACLASPERPVRVYESMMLVKKQAEIDDLKQQIATLKQNAEAAARAPVSAAGGSMNTQEADDPFLRGFNSY